ncbi:MAG: NCS2 family permease [Bacillota bacterium]
MEKLDKFFKLKENNTTISRELIAGATTFFAMVYIIFVNPAILNLGGAGIPWGAVFLATIFSSFIGTLIMGLFAKVPFAQAPGMGLNAFFIFTVVVALGFTWQEALAMVFICGVINIIITVTKVRKSLIKSIPKSLQYAIGGGIGMFIAYIGIKNAGLLSFIADPGTWVAPYGMDGSAFIDSSVIPELTKFSTMGPILAVIGIIITVVLLLFKVKGAILIGIIVTAIIGIPMGVTQVEGIFANYNIGGPFVELGDTIGAAFYQGMPTLFNDATRIPMVLLAIFAFSLTDMFDTIGTLIGTGRKSGIFSEEEFAALEGGQGGFKTKIEKALFADAVATSAGAILGTSNVTTYIESTTGIEAGGRTGLTSVFTAFLFLLCIFISPIVGMVPAQATAPALIIVGVMMASSFKNINWSDFAEAVPAFFTAIFMAFAYNISIGIAIGFIFYAIVKICKREAKDIHPIFWGSTGLFLLYFILMALFDAGII